jgi:hypothetical protein
MDVVARYKQEYQAVIAGPVAADVVDNALLESEVKDSIYRQWLIETGGGPIGSNWYDSPHELAASQKKLESESWSLSGWVIGWDGAGNPIAMQPDGSIRTEDHNGGGIHLIANSFAELLERGNGI